MRPADRDDYPVHEAVLMWQQRVLDRLLDPVTLARVRDSELKVPADEDALTTAELLDRLTKAILSEVDALGPGEYTNRKPAVASLRRGLQRAYMSRLADVALSSGAALPDAQALARLQLASSRDRIDALLARQDVKLDDVSRAHFIDLRARMDAVLDADLALPRP
jgi:hypothetical protein